MVLAADQSLDVIQRLAAAKLRKEPVRYSSPNISVAMFEGLPNMEHVKTVIRDFVYLDWERVRSMAAQLFRGIPEARMEGESREADAKGQLEGNALWLLKGQFGADYRYLRTENETRSFHHYVYSLVEEKLIDDESIIAIDANFDFGQWKQSFFHDGQ